MVSRWRKVQAKGSPLYHCCISNSDGREAGRE